MQQICSSLYMLFVYALCITFTVTYWKSSLCLLCCKAVFLQKLQIWKILFLATRILFQEGWFKKKWQVTPLVFTSPPSSFPLFLFFFLSFFLSFSLPSLHCFLLLHQNLVLIINSQLPSITHFIWRIYKKEGRNITQNNPRYWLPLMGHRGTVDKLVLEIVLGIFLLCIPNIHLKHFICYGTSCNNTLQWMTSIERLRIS
jgi:hypothetical protein